jgi:hypothetical protein
MANRNLERLLVIALTLVLSAVTTWVFRRISPGLVNEALLSVVYASWAIFWFFYLGLYLGLGLGAAPAEGGVQRKLIGTAAMVAFTVVCVLAGITLAETGEMGLSAEVLLSVLPLHWGLVWLVFAQNLGMA